MYTVPGGTAATTNGVGDDLEIEERWAIDELGETSVTGRRWEPLRGTGGAGGICYDD